jgi:tRNA(Ile)-lysidine synthase
MDLETLAFPLTVRSWKEGDRFQPLGTKGTRKVKNFFIDRKLPREERWKTPLVLFGERIVWVVGQRIDERVKITPSTQKVLEMRVFPAKFPVVAEH